MLAKEQQLQYLNRIESALRAATELALQYKAGTFEVCDRGGRDVVTEVDRRVSDMLRAELLRSGEGWLSEEDADDQARLSCDIVWVVDPLDGTREFVDGLPEWCISVGLVENGVAVAGGTSNPATGEIFLGAIDCGVSHNGCTVRTSVREESRGARVLASRSSSTGVASGNDLREARLSYSRWVRLLTSCHWSPRDWPTLPGPFRRSMSGISPPESR